MKSGFTWAIAGRSLERLSKQKNKLIEKKQEMKDLGIIVVESSDHKKLKEMCKRTKVVITCVSPYDLYGDPLLYACAKEGTDYIDVTGDHEWVAKSTKKFGEQAKKSGARIINQCGWDSIPYEYLVYEATNKLKSCYDDELKRIDVYLNLTGHFSGGSFLSMVRGIDLKIRASMHT